MLNPSPTDQAAAPTPPVAQPEASIMPGDDDGSDSIVANLEQHLNSIPDAQKAYLTDALMADPEKITNVLGIVCGEDVYNYFKQIASQATQQNSPAAAPQGPQVNRGPQMSPQSMPQTQPQMMAPQQ